MYFGLSAKNLQHSSEYDNLKFYSPKFTISLKLAEYFRTGR